MCARVSYRMCCCRGRSCCTCRRWDWDQALGYTGWWLACRGLRFCSGLRLSMKHNIMNGCAYMQKILVNLNEFIRIADSE